MDAVAAGAGGGGSAIGVEADFPAPAMHGYKVMKRAEQLKIIEAGRAALAARDDVVGLAGCGRLGAAGEGAVLVAQGHGAAQMGRDGIGRSADVEGEADGCGWLRPQAGAQAGGQARWPG